MPDERTYVSATDIVNMIVAKKWGHLAPHIDLEVKRSRREGMMFEARKSGCKVKLTMFESPFTCAPPRFKYVLSEAHRACVELYYDLTHASAIREED